MLSFTKGSKALIRHITFFVFLLSLCIPTIYVKAEILNSTKISQGTQVSTNDSIEHPKIEITYYDFEGKYITKEKGSDILPISKHYDPLSGADYEKYTVTKLNVTSEKITISLEGISEKPALERSITELIIKNPPKKTTYTEGESFNAENMVIMVCYSDGSWRDVKGYRVNPSGALSTDDKHVVISFTENGTTKSVTQNITVNAKEPDTFYISAAAAAGGTISDTGGSGIKGGNSKTYTISPYNGYRINYVEVDGNNVGAVTSYTFHNVWENHSINAYFMTGSAAKKLTVVGSFTNASGAGSYTPGTKVTVDAGSVPGFVFAGWTASDGIIYPMPRMSYTMPGYDVLLYANWIQSGLPNAFAQITTTNLKGQQLTSWADITNKLASFGSSDLNQPGSPILKVTAGGSYCYVDAAPIAMLNTRQGIALDVSYGADASFTFYSDMDNSLFTGSDFTYTCSTENTLFFHEKKLSFTQPGAINTGICLNMTLPDAQIGQTAYVYIVDEKGTEIMYLPTVVDAENKITIPLSAKVSLNIKY